MPKAMKAWAFFLLTSLFCLAAFAYVLLGLPPEASQGYVQKIFFFHVPAAFSMYATLFLAAGASIFYFFEKSDRADDLALAGLRVSSFWSLVVIVSGPLWAKPIWGVYWTWDPRLTTTFLITILLFGTLAARKLLEDRPERARLVSAVLTLFAVLDVPLIHFSVKLWRGIHPSVLRNPEGLPENFRTGLELMVTAFFLLSGFLVYLVRKQIQMERKILAKKKTY